MWCFTLEAVIVISLDWTLLKYENPVVVLVSVFKNMTLLDLKRR